MTPRLLLPLLALLLLPGCAGDPSTTTLAAPAQPPQPTRDRDGDGLTDAHDPTPLGFDGSTARQQPMGAQLHLHGSLSEFDGTMMYHTAQAEALGVDLIWWSDHDALISMMNRSRGFDWDEGSMGETLEVADLSLEHGFSVGSNTLGNASQQVLPGGPSGQGYYLQMEGEGKVDSDWRAMRLRYVGEFFAHQLPLLSDATVQLSVNPTTALGDDWRFQVVFLLSGNMGGTRNNIVYYLANEDLTVHNDVDTLYVPMTAPQGVWTTWTMPISADAEAYFPEMDDQSAQTIYVELMARNSAAASIDVDDLVYAWSLEDEKLRQRQVEVLADRYSDGNVTHFVGQEITLVDDGKHVNPLGEDIPLPDYHATGTLSLREATNYVHDHGGVAVCNHPFGIATRVIAEATRRWTGWPLRWRPTATPTASAATRWRWATARALWTWTTTCCSGTRCRPSRCSSPASAPATTTWRRTGWRSATRS